MKITRTGVAYFFLIAIFIVMQIFIHQYKIESEVGQEIMKIEENVPVIEANEKAEIWQIEIPAVALCANIAEGTSEEILNQFIGHFSNTQKENGNICLAAYNRGHENEYFKDLKKLQKGDEITYTYNQTQTTYEVKKCRIIKNTESKYLENTEENMLTLITFIENEPEYRRCIQAIEKEEE